MDQQQQQENLKYAALGRMYRLRELQTQREMIEREIAALERQLGLLTLEPLKKRAPGRPSKALLAAIEEGESKSAAVARVLQSAAVAKTPVKAPAKSTGKNWNAMTADERSAEMKRRMEVAKQKRAEAEAEEKRRRGSEAARAARKKWWASLTPKQQAAHLAKMRKGAQQKAAKTPRVKLVNGAAEAAA